MFPGWKNSGNAPLLTFSPMVYAFGKADYRLDLPDIGRFFHAALRNFAVTLQKKGLDWGKLDEESCLQLAVSEVERLVPRLQKEILLSSNRNRYLAEKFKETVSQTALILGEQARHSKFRPAGLELAFGPGRGLPGIVFELEGGFKVELIGVLIGWIWRGQQGTGLPAGDRLQIRKASFRCRRFFMA